jgi:hypothetical protein
MAIFPIGLSFVEKVMIDWALPQSRGTRPVHASGNLLDYENDLEYAFGHLKGVSPMQV